VIENVFRQMALTFPETIEMAHMGHPDFRVKGKIFATLPKPGEGLGMVKLTAEQQRSFVHAHPDIFVPCKGAWGRQGCTYVRLKTVKRGILRRALAAAWRNAAPKQLVEQMEVG
jgi:hypothetical protein